MNARCVALVGILLVVRVPIACGDGGIGGCMASSCHGSSQPDAPIWQRAGKVWFDNDPHAQAYAILHNEESRAMLERLLGRPLANEAERKQILESRCVSCHASENTNVDLRPLGIHCGSCHGPLNAWGEDHYSLATLSKKESRFDGTERVALPDWSTQVRKCAECHIGSIRDSNPSMHVDHQLMAAGHPPMPFEFSNYLERYPAHWSLAEDADSEQWMRWRIGKLETAKARLQLLIDRCQSEGDWPEFTEYSCSSCHHELDATGWRAGSKQKANQGGVAVWDDWYLNYLELAIEPAPETPWRTFASQLDALRSTMESKTPDRMLAANHASQLLESLQQSQGNLSRTNMDRDAVKQSLENLVDIEWPPHSLEQGVQWTLAVRAMTRSVQLPSPELNLGDDFYDGFFVSPRTWRRGQSSSFDGSSRFSPGALEEYRSGLRQHLGKQP